VSIDRPRVRERDDTIVSVVVCGHNGAKHLPGLLAALGRQTLARECFEVVYVDDASTDDSVAVVERSRLARVVRPEGRLGLPRARNAGIRAAHGDVLAFTDVDTVPDERWLEEGYRLFTDCGVDFLAGGITMPVGPRPTVAALVDATTYLDQELYVQAGFAAGANFWVRRSIAERVGGFNEHLEYYGGDDEEFGWRLKAAGVRLHYAPEVRLTHPPRERLRDIARKAYRGGESYAVRRRLSTGIVSGARPMFRQLRSYLPPKRLRRLSRVLELDYEPTVLELVQMHVVRYVCVQLMTLAGDFAGERRWRGRTLPASDKTERRP
jgi:GT2 family glycosyltransferase